MKYSTEIEINLPVNKVIELFDNPDNMKEWQPGLESFEHLSGTPGQPGAKSKLKYKMGKREIEMIETVTVRNLPEEFSGTYKAKGVFNIVKNKFVPLNDGKTKYITEHDFQFTGMMKLFGLLMPGAFRKESFKLMKQFKEFAEKSGK
ncbi:MAG: SRPBCC family protein [Ignavibacteriales bacterium]|nr:MAG: SRPBCC family protein [Ignavibacteriales bacterium]